MPTGILETPTIRPMSVTTTTVKSVWAKTPPITGGPFLPTAWADAATMPIPEGFVMVKNDNKFLYLLFDLTKDTGQSPGVGDYFWLTFDVDGNAAITPNLDVNYGIWPSLPIRIGKQFCLGPGIWTPISVEPTQSLARQEFCATQNSRTTHRIWELCIDLKEVSANLTNVAAPPILHFGLRVSSTTPQFTSDFPPNFYMDFSHLAGILLAANPSLPSIGKPVVAVGIVPVGTGNNDGLDPNTGRATTASGYYLEVKNAAFGGTLNLIGDPTILQSLPITAKYGVTLDGRPLLQSWSNYHYENNQWIYEYVAPDVNGKYNLIPPGEIYSIDHLLFQWNTVGIPTGTHRLVIDFGDGMTQDLLLMIDNNLPDVDILGIEYNGQTVQPCEIVNIVPSGGKVSVDYRAYDYAGDMFSYGITAYHGEGVADLILDAVYPSDGLGVTDGTAPALASFPPVSCAYEFRLWAQPNVINGYSLLGYTEATDHVTFNVPTAPSYKVLATKPIFPFGLKSVDGRTCKVRK